MIGAWVVLAPAMVPLQGPLQDRAADESDTFLVRGSESLEAKQLIDEKFRAGSESAAVIAYVSEGGLGRPSTSASRRTRDGSARRRSRA